MTYPKPNINKIRNAYDALVAARDLIKNRETEAEAKAKGTKENSNHMQITRQEYKPRIYTVNDVIKKVMEEDFVAKNLDGKGKKIIAEVAAKLLDATEETA